MVPIVWVACVFLGHCLARNFLMFWSISLVSGIGWTADVFSLYWVFRRSAGGLGHLESTGNLPHLRGGSDAVPCVLVVAR